MPTAVWIALAGTVVAVVALCTPAVVRLLSRTSPPREPPAQPRGLLLGTVIVPFRGVATVPGAQATGRFVRVKALPSGGCVFTLRDMWISADLGLPAAGLMLDGSMSPTPDGAKVSVYAPMASVVPIGLVWALLMIGSAIFFFAAPSLGGAAFVTCGAWFGYVTWKRARCAVKAVAADAVEALQQTRAVTAHRDK